jgi:hypothetical protein
MTTAATPPIDCPAAIMPQAAAPLAATIEGIAISETTARRTIESAYPVIFDTPVVAARNRRGGGGGAALVIIATAFRAPIGCYHDESCEQTSSTGAGLPEGVFRFVHPLPPERPKPDAL